MAAPRCALRFDCVDGGLGLDFLLACNYCRDSDRDRLTREISEGATVVLDSAVRVAFLGGLSRAGLASILDELRVNYGPDGEEPLIE